LLLLLGGGGTGGGGAAAALLLRCALSPCSLLQGVLPDNHLNLQPSDARW
jgi:hypothetical protein